MLSKLIGRLSDSQRQQVEDFILDMVFYEASNKNKVEKITRVESQKKKPNNYTKFFPLVMHNRKFTAMAQLAVVYGVDVSYIYNRLRKGMSFEDIFPDPPKPERIQTLIKKKGQTY